MSPVDAAVRKITRRTAVAALGALPLTALARPFGGVSAGGGTTPTISTSTSLSAVVGTFVNQALAATGGSGNYSFSKVSARPNFGGWCQVNGSAIVGTPQQDEVETVVIQVTDTSTGLYSQSTFTITVSVSGSLAIQTSATLPGAINNSAYYKQLVASGGRPPYQWSCSAAAQPWWVSLDGWCYGTPTSTGTSSPVGTVTVTDAARNTATFTPSVTIATGFVLNGVDSDTGYLRLPDAIVGNKYHYQAYVYGGTGSGQTFTISAGSLPAGLSMSSGGLITGTPTQSGAVLPTIHVVDSGSNTTSKQALITVDNSTAVSRPSYNSNSANGFFTLGTKFYDPNGHEFRIRGINRNHYDSATWASGANGALSGANTVREDFGFGGAAQTGAQMATQIANEYAANGLYTIVTLFTIETQFTATISGGTTLTVSAVNGTMSETNGGIICLGMSLGGAASGGKIQSQSSGTTGGVGVYVLDSAQSGSGSMTGTMGNTTSGSDPNCILCATNIIIYVLANGLSAASPNFAINIANECGPGNSTGWRDAYITSVAAFRAAGFNGPLVIDTGGGAQDEYDIELYAAAVLATDPLKNIIFSYHVYGTCDPTVGIITGISNANPCLITIAGGGATHPFGAGYPTNHFNASIPFYVQGVLGMTQINGTVAAGTGNLYGSSGAWQIQTSVDSTAFGTYTSGGTIVDSGGYVQLINRLAAASVAGSFCLIIGEIGPGYNVGFSPTIVTPDQVIAVAEANGLGWAEWAFDDNNQGGNQSSWSTWFGATGPLNTAFTNGTYVPATPSCLTQPGLDYIPHPRHGLQALANRAHTYL